MYIEDPYKVLTTYIHSISPWHIRLLYSPPYIPILVLGSHLKCSACCEEAPNRQIFLLRIHTRSKQLRFTWYHCNTIDYCIPHHTTPYWWWGSILSALPVLRSPPYRQIFTLRITTGNKWLKFIWYHLDTTDYSIFHHTTQYWWWGAILSSLPVE